MFKVHLIPRFKQFVLVGLTLLMLAVVTLQPIRQVHADPTDPTPTPTVPATPDGWTDPVGG